MVTGLHPVSLEEALALLRQESAIPYGGGTDLMVHPPRTGRYLFLNRVPELSCIEKVGKTLSIGAMCNFTRLMEEPSVPPLVREAVRHIAAPAIRNMGTVGGNLCNGSPKADCAMALMACGASVRLCSAGNARIVPLEDFYLGRKQTARRNDELLTEILVPLHTGETWFYQKVGGREALAISRLSFAGVLRMEDGRIASCTAVFGGVADQILRFPFLEAELTDRTAEEAGAITPKLLEAYSRAIVPVPGRVSAEYRHKVCLNLLRGFWAENGLWP